MEGSRIDPGLTMDSPRNLPAWTDPELALQDSTRTGPVAGPWIGLGLTKDCSFGLDMDRPRTDRSGTGLGLVSRVRPKPVDEPFTVPKIN